MKKRMNSIRKTAVFCVLLCICMLLGACGREDDVFSQSGESVRIEQSSYYYDQGYLQAGGWLYDMTIASDNQLRRLDEMVDSLTLNWTGEDFMLDQGYRLIWKDASGSVVKEMLVIDGSSVSMEGILYDASAQTLYSWLEALEIDKQSVE